MPDVLLPDVKMALRISHTAMDSEIEGLIAAARGDLIRTGLLADMVNAETVDPLIKQAITTYVKANFGLDNEDSDKYQRSYAMLRNDLSLSQDYLPVGDADV
ncbi:head-tail connector protein [Sporolactobacillus nakayamae]|uniref:Uncharacterized phage protein (Possible DNA packaging) n=1 Tax=Sporolactobacillus nakayamae TaxID=269670 RepID=A0A1I2P2Y1_9BACL|nr:head-tail connector protein [Sporolactobacillus nakayamae]SFG10565.1 uncharacterized phage protein (possible DNA packaging) [Sporolactobacillus nakayamae]